MIKKIHELDNEAQVYLIGNNRSGGLDVVKKSELVQDIFQVQPDTTQNEIIRWINNKKIDVILDPAGSGTTLNIVMALDKSNVKNIFRSFEICHLTKGIFYYRFKALLRILLFNKKVNLVPVLHGRHEIDCNYDALEAFYQKPFEREYQTWVSSNVNSDILERFELQKKNYICIQPSAANGTPTPKTWDPENFVALARKIANQYPQFKIILLGSTGDHQNVISKYGWPSQVINTAGKTSIDDLIMLLSNAASVIAHDSGIMHLTNALEIPLIVLYGPTDYTWTMPKGKHTKILFSKTEAFAVMYKKGKSERQLAEEYPNHVAMSGIGIDDVFNALKEVIESEWSISSSNCCRLLGAEPQMVNKG